MDLVWIPITLIVFLPLAIMVRQEEDQPLVLLIALAAIPIGGVGASLLLGGNVVVGLAALVPGAAAWTAVFYRRLIDTLAPLITFSALLSLGGIFV